MEPLDIQFLGEGEAQVALLLAMLDDNTKQWRGMLGDVSEEALVWQPVAQGHSIGAVLLHNTDVEAYWLHEVLAGEMMSSELRKLLLSDETDQFGGIWPAPPSQPLSWYYAQHDTIRERTRQIIRELQDPTAAFGKERKFTLRWLLHHVITHEAYHCGQIALLAAQFGAKAN